MTTRSPDQIVVDGVFHDFATSEYPGETEDVVFEKFGAYQVLKPRQLSPDDLAAGIVDGDRDGGIDSFYAFLNGTLLSSDDPVHDKAEPANRALGKHPELEVFLVQSKNTEGWAEATWEHLLFSLRQLLDAEADDAQLEKLYRTYRG